MAEAEPHVVALHLDKRQNEFVWLSLALLGNTELPPAFTMSNTCNDSLEDGREVLLNALGVPTAAATVVVVYRVPEPDEDESLAGRHLLDFLRLLQGEHYGEVVNLATTLSLPAGTSTTLALPPRTREQYIFTLEDMAYAVLRVKRGDTLWASDVQIVMDIYQAWINSPREVQKELFFAACKRVRPIPKHPNCNTIADKTDKIIASVVATMPHGEASEQQDESSSCVATGFDI